MDASALSGHLIDFLQGLNGVTAYAAVLGLLLVCGLGVPLPEDITLLGAGVLAAMDAISLPGAILAGFVGVLAGDIFLFTLGRQYGRAVFDLPGFRRVFTPERIAVAERKVLANSKFICFTARFLPGLRAPIFLTSGILGVRPIIFYALDGFAALISVPVWVVIGWWFTLNLDVDAALAYAKKAQGVIFGSVLLLAITYYLVRKVRRRHFSGSPPIAKNNQ